MKFVRYYIFSMIITGLVFLFRFILSSLLGLFMTSPGILATVLAIIIVFGLSIWYVDYNMKR